jgi:hypothetical protein
LVVVVGDGDDGGGTGREEREVFTKRNVYMY